MSLNRSARQCLNARFYQFYVFLCAVVGDNYCKIERFIVKIENFHNFLENFKSAQKKSVMRLPARCDAKNPEMKFSKDEFFEDCKYHSKIETFFSNKRRLYSNQ